MFCICCVCVCACDNVYDVCGGGGGGGDGGGAVARLELHATWILLEREAECVQVKMIK